MAQVQKTTAVPLEVASWLAAVLPERRAEAARLRAIYGEVTGFPPYLWGGSMVGFGRYAYRYASGHAGEWFASGFAPRKAELVLYGLPGEGQGEALFGRLGRHRRGKGCVYLKRLEAVDEAALRDLIRAGLEALAAQWTVLPE